ncbi:MAG: YeeE/YedE thiosulfate transporter family protein [Methanomicrobiales archaeon]|nr:YeeE/YedE thiosulfate transporter family protein [Methanomicrobiales archaeon]
MGALFSGLHKDKGLQIILGLLFGVVFGFLLQKGGVTSYNVIIAQLLLTDFTVMKVMLSAVIVGMIGLALLKHFGYVQPHPASGTIGSNVIGGLIFGFGFALLGYCPGTVAGAVGAGALDALIGGVVGILVGTAIFAELYPVIKNRLLIKGPLPAITVQELLRLNIWLTIIIMEAAMIGFLLLLEYVGY